MSCIRPVNSEPEFERVATLHRRELPHLPSYLNFIPTANSSPKLRLNFDDQDSLMTDTDFEGIMHQYNEDDNVIEERTYDIDDYYRQSVLLPPTPGLDPPRPVFVTNPTNMDIPNTNYPINTTGMNVEADAKMELSNAGTKETIPDIPAYLHQGIARLGFAPENATATNESRVPPNTVGTNACWASDLRFRNDGNDDVFLTPPTKRVLVVARDDYHPHTGHAAKEEGNDNGKAKEKLRPGPISVLPRVGTLTALPGTKIVGTGAVGSAGHGGIPKDEPRPGPSTSRIASTSMPPPKTPVTPLSAPAAPGYRKRKLSLSAPLSSIKRILTPSGAMRKRSITHLTHEATAGNRTEAGGAGSVDGGNHDDETLNTPTTARRGPTPIFTGPYVTSIDPSSPAGATTSTPAPKQSTPRTVATNLLRPLHRDTSTSKAKAASGKQTLNNMIIQLRGQVSDLTIENRVLNDQVDGIRKDWYETARELDLARYDSWNHEMKAYTRGIMIEELRAEVRALKVENGALKRGSVAN